MGVQRVLALLAVHHQKTRRDHLIIKKSHLIAIHLVRTMIRD